MMKVGRLENSLKVFGSKFNTMYKSIVFYWALILVICTCIIYFQDQSSSYNSQKYLQDSMFYGCLLRYDQTQCKIRSIRDECGCNIVY